MVPGEHGCPEGHWHFYEWQQNPETCECFMHRRFGGCIPPKPGQPNPPKGPELTMRHEFHVTRSMDMDLLKTYLAQLHDSYLTSFSLHFDYQIVAGGERYSAIPNLKMSFACTDYTEMTAPIVQRLNLVFQDVYNMNFEFGKFTSDSSVASAMIHSTSMDSEDLPLVTLRINFNSLNKGLWAERTLISFDFVSGAIERQ
jgi:hypothetical protein